MARDYFAGVAGNDRDLANRIARQRLGLLVCTADLSSMSQTQFVMACQLFNGLATSDVHSAKGHLLQAVHDAIQEQDDSRADIASKQFPGNTPESLARFLRELDEERERLHGLTTVIKSLNEAAAVALLYLIEEFHAGDGDHLRGRCQAVYEKMQAQRLM